MQATHKKMWFLNAIILLVFSWGLFGQHAAWADTAFKVALLLPRAVDADGWTKAGYAGLQLIEKELQAEIAYSESAPEEEFEQLFRQYAQNGFDFIIGHGKQFVPAAEVVAKEFPRIKFAVITKYAGNNKNLGALFVHEGELGYLAGVVAALKTTSGKVGYIGGVQYSSSVENVVLFERAVEQTNSEIAVSIDWVGSWTDREKAERLARAQIAENVDVLVVNAGEAGLTIHAIAEQAGIHTIGWIEDAYKLAPDAVLTSSMQNIAKLLLQGALLARKGYWEGKQYKFGLREGVQFLAPFRGMLTPEQEAHVQAIQEDMMQGNIDLTP